MLFKCVSILFLFLGIGQIYAQCPSGVQSIANGKCFELDFGSPQSPPPGTITDPNGTVYSLVTPIPNPDTGVYEYTDNNNCNGNIGGFSGTLNVNGEDCTYMNGVLPVDLLKYEISQVEETIEVYWESEDETNHSHFEIEKMALDKFETKATINVYDNIVDGRKKYSYRDSSPSKGISTYRLVQYDLDGKRTTYPNLYFNWSEGDGTWVPFTHKGSYLDVDYERAKRVQIYDIYFEKAIDQVIQQGSIDLTPLQTGIYIFMIIDGGIDHVEKFYVP